MSKGSPIVPIRIPQSVLTQIDAIIATSGVDRFEEPHTRTSWILSAINGKLLQKQRGVKRRAANKAKRAAQRSTSINGHATS